MGEKEKEEKEDLQNLRDDISKGNDSPPPLISNNSENNSNNNDNNMSDDNYYIYRINNGYSKYDDLPFNRIPRNNNNNHNSEHNPSKNNNNNSENSKHEKEWIAKCTIVPSYKEDIDYRFGISVTISNNNVLVIGTAGKLGGIGGTVYVYSKRNSWTNDKVV